MAELELKGLEEVMGKLKTLEELKFASAALKAGAEHIKGKIAEYPPASEANQPKEKGRWYERGYGPRWPGGGKRTSQTLGRKWTIGERDSGMTWVVGNNVTYGPFVQSAERQVWFHKARGWKTDEQVVDEEKETVTNNIIELIEQALK